MADLSVEVAGVHFKNPLSLGSAEPTESFDKMKRAIDQGAGSVVAKSFSSGTEMRRQTDIAKFVFMDYNRRPAHGKDIPKFFSHYCRSGMIQMPEDDWMEELYKTEQYAKTHDSIVIGSVAGCPTIDETVRLAKRMDQEVGLKMLEFDLACPQVDQMVEKGALLKEKEDYFARAKALADKLMEHGFDLVSGGTDNHLILIDLRTKNTPGKKLAKALDRAGIVTNYNTIPSDPAPPFNPSGLRIGTPAVTTRGMKEEQMEVIADLINKITENIDNESVIEQVCKESLLLCSSFPVPESFI